MPAISTARTLTFTIPGSPALKVIATENAGKIDFTLDVQDTTQLTGDLRGFFFDTNEAKMGGMKVTGSSLLTQAKVGANAQLDLGNGDTMAGKTSAKFDVGLEIGTVGFAKDDVSGAVSFTLANTANNLTLDDIAGMRFGAKIDSVGAVGTARTGTQTILATASAAPDAKDDIFTIKEDGATAGANMIMGATAASGATKAVTLNVLANDTDGDRDALTIIGLGTGPQHGSVTIAADGKSLLYTPTHDYSGTDTFQYGVSDGKGGTDYATVNLTITPVADAPVISFTTSAGAHINETVVHVTASVTDLDGSEVISAITPAGLSADQTLTATGTLHAVAGQPGTYTQDFLLTTAKTQSYHEDLGFTATATEQANGAIASTMGSTHFDYDYKSTTNAVEFTAYNQNMWGGDQAFKFDYDKFLGLDLGDFKQEASVGVDLGLVSGDIHAGVEAAFKVGLDTHIHINGGSIDVVSDYDVTVGSAYNHTLDTLVLDTQGTLTNLSTSTQSPEGSVYLALIVKAIARVYAGFSIGTPEIHLPDPLPNIPGVNYSYNHDIPGSINYDNTFVLVNGNSDGAHSTVTLPDPLDSLSVDFAWPTIRTSESGASSSLINTGDSGNFLQLNLDVDQALSTLITYLATEETDGPNYFHPDSSDTSIGPLSVDLTLYDATLTVGSFFRQIFHTDLDHVDAVVTLEDGFKQTFKLGDTLTFDHASSHDANHDGTVGYTLDLVPVGTLNNETKVGFNLDYAQTVGQLKVGIDTPIGDFDANFGPFYERDDPAELGNFTLYQDTFALHFQHQTVANFA